MTPTHRGRGSTDVSSGTTVRRTIRAASQRRPPPSGPLDVIAAADARMRPAARRTQLRRMRIVSGCLPSYCHHMDSQVAGTHDVDVRDPRGAFVGGSADPGELVPRVSGRTARLPPRLPFLADKH